MYTTNFGHHILQQVYHLSYYQKYLCDASLRILGTCVGTAMTAWQSASEVMLGDLVCLGHMYVLRTGACS